MRRSLPPFRAVARPLTAWALVLTVLGWSLFWAQALGIFNMGAIWIPLGLLAIGLALIPIANKRGQ